MTNPDFTPMSAAQIQTRINTCRQKAIDDPEHAVEWNYRATLWGEILQNRITDGHYQP